MISAAQLIDQMTGVILAGFVRTAAKADHKQAQENVRLFLNENIDRLIRWAKEQPGKRPPVYYDSDTGGVMWLNRSQLRRLKRRQAKLHRGLA